MERSEAFKNIVAEAVRGDLTFPTSAKVALRVREVLDNPECALDEVVRLVKAEPLIAARVVALANSVAFNPHPGGRSPMFAPPFPAWGSRRFVRSRRRWQRTNWR
jgi:hypothetical protein